MGGGLGVSMTTVGFSGTTGFAAGLGDSDLGGSSTGSGTAGAGVSGFIPTGVSAAVAEPGDGRVTMLTLIMLPVLYPVFSRGVFGRSETGRVTTASES